MKSPTVLKELNVIHIGLFLGLVLLYFEIVGTSRPGCSNPIGLEGTVEDSRFSSYTHMVGWDAFMARLCNHKAWCSATNRINLEFLQIDLGKVQHLSCIATQGVHSSYPLFSSYVMTFIIKYSYNGTTWFPYKGNGGSVQTFDANNDTSSVRYNHFRHLIEARYLRIYPMNFYHCMCLRVELYDSNDQSAPAPTPQLSTRTSSVPTKAAPSITINKHTLHSLISHVTESLTKGKTTETPEVSNTTPSSTDPFTKVPRNKSVDPAHGSKDNPFAYMAMTRKVVLVIAVAVIVILLRTLCLCCENRERGQQRNDEVELHN
ncbi:venom prothrombin activator oscutarin-C non-catalytic subunit-like isoform X2 [Acropora muricata]|uniref:venom prothrombin activator oscutarin-C non-catalytic subunit-like isoform X2 n=1 Tax=Acropora muricata TaxID=159855 RepID=UPI0034E46924